MVILVLSEMESRKAGFSPSSRAPWFKPPRVTKIYISSARYMYTCLYIYIYIYIYRWQLCFVIRVGSVLLFGLRFHVVRQLILNIKQQTYLMFFIQGSKRHAHWYRAGFNAFAQIYQTTTWTRAGCNDRLRNKSNFRLAIPWTWTTFHDFSRKNENLRLERPRTSTTYCYKDKCSTW